jgi:hypothetical protein
VPELDIETIHELLETLVEAKRQVERQRSDPIDVEQLYLLSTVVFEVVGYTSSGYDANPLGVNSSVLSKLMRLRGTVYRSDAMMLAERLRTYLKSQDQSAAPVAEPLPPPRPLNIPLIHIKAEAWIIVPPDSEMREKISNVSALLDSILRQVRGSNLPQSEQALSEIERQQLIAILETALNILRSPAIEKGLMRKTKDLLTTSAQKAAEKEAQEGMGKLMKAGATILGELVKSIFTGQ